VKPEPHEVLAECARKIEGVSPESLETWLRGASMVAGDLHMPAEARAFAATFACVCEDALTGLVDWDELLELGAAAKRVGDDTKGLIDACS
jgi:hypothetical protein